MNNLLKKLTPEVLVYFILVMIALGAVPTIVSLIYTVAELGLYKQNLCFSSSCIGSFISKTENSFIFLKWAGSLSAGGGAFLAVIIGLMSYIASQRMADITSNISQYEHFSKYVYEAQSKHKRINKGSIDTLKWYRSMYVEPSKNNFEISEAYLDHIIDIDRIMQDKVSGYISGGGSYNYKQHQMSVISHLNKIGISMETGPRTEFDDTEKEVVSFINSTNALFLPSDVLIEITY